MKNYGISSFQKIENNLDVHIENIRRRGFTIVRNHVSNIECDEFSSKMENVYDRQQDSFGKENLIKINELNVARMLFASDSSFLKLIIDEKILEIVSSFLGENYILHLQNGVLNRPNKDHHQTSWHRDIPYQEYTLSNPISINVFYCFSPFNEKTGGTVFLPYSHLFSGAPSTEFFLENQIQPSLDKGDVIIFDSWLYHKAGYNSSDIVRYGVNNVYTTPILNQQINIPKMLNGMYKEIPMLNKILGYKFETSVNVDDYRKKRLFNTKT